MSSPEPFPSAPVVLSVRAQAISWLAIALIVTAIAPSASAVTIDWVTIGAPGNAADSTGYGAVGYTYQVSAFEITNAQYTEFLNAKAASNSLALYDFNMGGTFGGIVQSGSPGSYSYSTIAGREDNPAVYVTFYNALRFVNWLENGQGSGDTETGTYTLLGGTPIPTNGASIARNPGASLFLTNEDEWYKAAYYDVLSGSYDPYPFADGLAGTCEAPSGTTSHSANCFFEVVDTSAAGAYLGSLSANGTFDQSGNVAEWNEDLVGSNRRLRGGSWRDASTAGAASSASSAFPTIGTDSIGFRVASLPVPEPGTAVLVASGLLGIGVHRRGRIRCRPARGRGSASGGSSGARP